MSRPANRPIAIVRGDDYQHLVSLTDENGAPLDVSANTYAAQLRTSPDATTALADFTIDDSGAAAGAIWLTLPKADTALLRPGRRVWDLEETDADGNVTTLLGGYVDVVADVTRSEAP